MYTEKEAMDKWCPQARIAFKTNTWATSVNRGEMTDDEDDTISVCMASRCMMWRWGVDEKGNSKMVRIKFDKVCPECNGDGCEECDGNGKIGEFAPLGYCGLGGKPCQ